MIKVPPDLRVPSPVTANGNPVLRGGTADEMERAGHDAEPAFHTLRFMEDNDAVLDLDRLLPAVVDAGAAAGAEPGVTDRFLDTGDPDLVEPLALAAVRAG